MKKNQNSGEGRVEASYSFNFVGGGTNSVRARSKGEAYAKARETFPQWPIEPKSFRRLDAKGWKQYCDSLPLID